MFYLVNNTALSVDLAAGRVTFPGQTWSPETLFSIENSETGSGNDTVAGSSAANVIRTYNGDDSVTALGGADTVEGGDGNDTLRGGEGNDSLTGGLGDDRLYGEGGNDTLEGGDFGGDAGHDYIDGGSGTDTAVYSQNSPDFADASQVIINLALGVATVIGADASETLASIENVITGNGDDIVTGSNGANVIRVGYGLNTVLGGGGNDTIYGGNSSDGSESAGYFGENIDGGSGNDVIHGGGSYDQSIGGIRREAHDGYEVLKGGGGNDRIYMDYGDLHASGGSGADQFRFSDKVYELFTSGGDGEIIRYACERASIDDFSRSEGDKLYVDLNVATDLFDNTDPYVRVNGAPDAEREWGWYRDGGDTVVQFAVVDRQEFQPWNPSQLLTVDIRLEDYTGPLNESDFVFV